MSYIEQIDKTRIPQHVAIIMDGNGRWAKQRGEERTYGHRAGAETVQNRFNVIGDFKKLPVEVQKSLTSCIERTSKNSGMYMVLALSYSSRWEITEAVRQIATQVKTGEISPEQITDECISSHLDTNFMRDPDLLIRTGGEIRLSNYLLWQCAYSELYFCDTFWPDFDKEELYKAIWEYQQRERRFGKTSEQIS